MQALPVPDDGEQVAADVVGARLDHGQRDRGGQRGIDRGAAPDGVRPARRRRRGVGWWRPHRAARTGADGDVACPLSTRCRECHRVGPPQSPPGRCTGPCPCQSVTSASRAATCRCGQGRGRGAELARPAVQHPGTYRGRQPDQHRHRQPRRFPQRVSRRDPGGDQGGGGQRVQRGGVLGDQPGGPGQVRHHPGTERGDQRGQQVGPDPGPGVRRGRCCAGPPTGSARAPRTPCGSRSRSTSSSGRSSVTPASSRRAGIPASPRGPPPRASASSTVSAWSSRVCPSSTAAASCRWAASTNACVAGLPGSRLRPTRPTPDHHRGHLDRRESLLACAHRRHVRAPATPSPPADR